jgi:hypothetical protein
MQLSGAGDRRVPDCARCFGEDHPRRDAILRSATRYCATVEAMHHVFVTLHPVDQTHGQNGTLWKTAVVVMKSTAARSLL